VSPPVSHIPTEEDFRLDLPLLMTVFAVMLATLLEIIDTSIVNVALPEMMGNLGATVDEIGWVVTGYIVSNVIIIPMTNWLATRFGRKRYLTGSVLLFTAASVLCGQATSLEELVVFRIIQGLGGGALLATAQSVMIESFPPSKQGIGQAIFGVGAMIGPSLGPTLGGFIVDQSSWPWIFYINLPLGLLAAALCAIYLKDPPHLTGRRDLNVDVPGIALLVVGIASLQTVFERGHRLDWFESDLIVGLSVTAALALALFVWRELTTDEPVVDLRVLRYRSLWVGCTLGAVMGIGLYGSIFLFPVYSQTVLGWNAWNSGMAILPSSIATALTMMVVGRLVWRLGPRPIYLTGVGIFMVALVGMMGWTHQSGWNDLLWPQIGRGLAMGAMFVPLSTATLRTLPASEVQKGAGLYNLFRQLGGSFGIAILSTMIDQRGAVHRAAIGEHVTALSVATRMRLGALQSHFIDRGFDAATAYQAAVRTLSDIVHQQAAALAFEDAYAFIFAASLLALPLAFLIRGGVPHVVALRADRRPLPPDRGAPVAATVPPVE